MTTTAARASASRWYSYPSVPAGRPPNQFMKKPLPTWVLMAPIMIPATPSAASRPPSPSTRPNGAASSVTMASAASGAGKPRVAVIHSKVPPNPKPPNQPRACWAPWGAMMRPRARRATRAPASLEVETSLRSMGALRCRCALAIVAMLTISSWTRFPDPGDRSAVRGGAAGRRRAGSPTLGVRGPDRVERGDELLELLVVQRGHGLLVALVDPRVELVQQSLAGGGGVADHLPAVGQRPLPSDEPSLLELVQQAGDRRPLLDHALPNGERRDAACPRPAHDAESVVLGEAQPGG